MGGAGDSAAAGWYPDPRGSGNLFYWNGSQWTGDVHAPTPPAQPQPSRPFQGLGRARTLVLCGGAALAISPFLTWLKVILLGNLSLFQLFEAAGRANGWAWAAVLAGTAAAIVAFRGQSPATIRRTGLGVGLLGGVLATYALIGLRDELRDAHGLAAIGIGPYMAIGGCVAMVIGAVMLRRKPAIPGQGTSG